MTFEITGIKIIPALLTILMVTGHPEMFFLMHVCICVVAIFHFDWSHKLEEDQRLITAEVVVLTCQTQLTFQSVPLLPFSFFVKEEPRNQKILCCVLYREVTVGSCWTASCTVTTTGSQTKEELFGVFAASVCKKKKKNNQPSAHKSYAGCGELSRFPPQKI